MSVQTQGAVIWALFWHPKTRFAGFVRGPGSLAPSSVSVVVQTEGGGLHYQERFGSVHRAPIEQMPTLGRGLGAIVAVHVPMPAAAREWLDGRVGQRMNSVKLVYGGCKAGGLAITAGAAWSADDLYYALITGCPEARTLIAWAS